MAGYGVSDSGIATVLNIPTQLLRTDYRKELKGGGIKANAKVAESLYRRATGEGREAVTAAIFWLKTRAGWRETSVHEIEGKLPPEAVPSGKWVSPMRTVTSDGFTPNSSATTCASAVRIPPPMS